MLLRQRMNIYSKVECAVIYVQCVYVSMRRNLEIIKKYKYMQY